MTNRKIVRARSELNIFEAWENPDGSYVIRSGQYLVFQPPSRHSRDEARCELEKTLLHAQGVR